MTEHEHLAIWKAGFLILDKQTLWEQNITLERDFAVNQLCAHLHQVAELFPCQLIIRCCFLS